MPVAFPPSEARLIVNTPHGEGYVYCIETSGMTNTVWTVILRKDGRILHYDSLQLRATINHTLEINLKNEKPKFPADV